MSSNVFDDFSSIIANTDDNEFNEPISENSDWWFLKNKKKWIDED